MTDIKPNIVLVDDHILLRNGLANLIRSSGKYNVLFEADNGRKFINQLDPINLPDIVLLDINMPDMDGYETSLWLKKNHPIIKVIALSMYDSESAIVQMLRNGSRGYVLKDIEPNELLIALDSVYQKGYYYSEIITGKLIYNIHNTDSFQNKHKNYQGLNEREIAFLKLICTEKTYKEIADNMCLSPRTIDGYRDSLFEKLGMKTRVGLVMYAIKNGFVDIQ